MLEERWLMTSIEQPVPLYTQTESLVPGIISIQLFQSKARGKHGGGGGLEDQVGRIPK